MGGAPGLREEATAADRLLERGGRQGSLTCDEIAAGLSTAAADARALDRFISTLDERCIGIMFPKAPAPVPGAEVPPAEQHLRTGRIAVARSRLRVMLLPSPIGAEVALETLQEPEQSTRRRVRSLLEDAKSCYARLIRGGNGMWNEMVLRHTVGERSHRWSRLLEGTPIPPERMRAALDRLEAYFARLADLRSSGGAADRERRHLVLRETLEGYAPLQSRLVELRKRYEDYVRATRTDRR